ncbi:MAG: DUF2764 domain-containing protein [Tannerella sp.]|jgi:hypothetical protein|nr:DUF2764 domain-containing protein [Tannerella sp.]
MSKYYYLISGLPAISLDDTRPVYTVADFKAEIEPVLSVWDRKTVRRFFLKYDNRNLLAHLRNVSGSAFDERGVFSEATLKDICELMKTEDRVPADIHVPEYFRTFTAEYYARFEDLPEAEESHVLWEDKLSSLYYGEAVKCRNKFMSSWFEMNLNINNVMTAVNCRNHGLDRADFIIGDNETAEQLRTSNARDFNLGNTFDYLTEVMQISEEKDLRLRERRLDALRWNWLEEQTLSRFFDIESVIAYLLRLEMIERWLTLDRVSGEKTFRRLVHTMKSESSETLEKFKENNK